MTIYADYTSRWFDLERLLDETFIQEIEFHRECKSTNDLALSTTADWKSPTLLLTDSQTGELLAAAVDRRVGGKSLRGVTGSWSDVHDSFKVWGERLGTRLADWK